VEEWPDNPSLRYLVYWALRRDDLCNPPLCPDAPDGSRCDHCTLNRIDEAQNSETGVLIRRALDMRAALKLGIRVSLEEIRADEFMAMQILEEERDRHEREQTSNHGQQ
jgi:hypothetical protein